MKFFANLSANSIQLIVNQVCGLAIFYILSNNLDKNSFGQINFTLAILLTVFAILSFGIDEVVIRKIASGEEPAKILSIYMLHVLITGSIFYIAWIIVTFLPGNLQTSRIILLGIGAGKLMIFFSTPFKQIATGKETFKALAYMSVASNMVRAAGLLAFALLHRTDLVTVVFIFILGDAAELALCTYMYYAQRPVRSGYKPHLLAYKQLIKESFPQLGVVLFTSVMARFDWIFIGLFLSAAKLAEYSFAYKVFELCTLPLLAIAPLLLPWFTRAFNNSGLQDTERFKSLLQYELLIAFLIAILLYVCWLPIIGPLTNGKYGAVNSATVFWLAMCMPLLYFSNFLWTICFARKKMRFILLVIGLTCSLNVLGNILLIPLLKNEGAALSYFVALLAQALLYSLSEDVRYFRKMWVPVVLCYASALLAGYISLELFSRPADIILSTVSLFIALLILTGQFRRSHLSKNSQLLPGV